MAGESIIGARDLQAIDSHWVKRYGSFLPAVWLGDNQLIARDFSLVLYVIMILSSDPGLQAKKIKD
jgi:hypothetical protein